MNAGHIIHNHVKRVNLIQSMAISYVKIFCEYKILQLRCLLPLDMSNLIKVVKYDFKEQLVHE